MKLIIDIPAKVVKAIQNGKDYRYDIHTAIAQATPLPKGYGRLIDADAVIAEAISIMKDSKNPKYMECVIAWMNLAPTIIEADKEV